MTSNHRRPMIPITNPGGFAEALPFLLGHYPDDSLVLHCFPGTSIADGFVVTTPISDDLAHAEVAAHHVLDLAHTQDTRPDSVILYLCREPAPGHSPRHTIDTLRLLAERVTDVFTAHGIRVREALGLTTGRWWSYLCPRPDCCDGIPLPPIDAPDSTRAALVRNGCTHGPRAAEITAQLAPLHPDQVPEHLTALEAAHTHTTAPLPTNTDTHDDIRQTTLDLLDATLKAHETTTAAPDPDTTARLILGLQDLEARDHALYYADGHTRQAAHNLWTHLARHCIPPYNHMAAAPLTLLAWTNWSHGDTVTARLALQQALTADPDYTLAGLLHELVNTDTDPEPFRTVLREAAVAEHADGQAPRC